ncbi:MAG: terminase gpA endonuclease subunit, partial [Gemmatimonadales bacterium]|nr:terminase gpA endonuclease subunit [Gemmatimonadales bacterium]
MPADKSSYDKHKAQVAKNDRAESQAGRDIGPLLPDEGVKRKKAAAKSLRKFCEHYLPDRFFLSWSGDHLKAIEKLEAAVLHGGLFALAMPRASGKTSLVEAAALWAILYGHRRFVVLIGATDDAAKEMLDSIKVAVEANDALYESFHAACQPVRALEGIPNRAAGQLLGGKRTRIVWSSDEIVFPTVDGAPSSGAIIRVAGITGRVRGMKAATADGKTIRPDFAIADDPQTDGSAISLTEIDKRERALRGAIKGLAGPGKTIAMVVPCTVIAPGDLSDRILDRERNPQFQGERFKLLYSFPERLDLWDQYAELRRDSLRNDRRGAEATTFYRKNRKEMDRGAVVAWPQRYDKASEASALQMCMNLWIDHRRAFLAEYQNEPETDRGPAGAKELMPAELIKRLSGVGRGSVPPDGVRLTAFFDCGGLLHWYAVCAWTERFGGSLIDYGAWPRQNRAVFGAADPRPSLADAHPGLSEPERVYAGLSALAGEVLGREYAREGTGERMRVERCLVDAGWQSQTVYAWCRQTPFAGLVYPSKGIGRTATARGVSEWKPRPGERAGHHWRLTMSETGKGRMVQFDPDAWKTFLWERLTAPLGGPGCLLLHGSDPAAHELLAEHLAAETAEPVTLRGQTFDKWSVRPHRPDNHLLDCYSSDMEALTRSGWRLFSDLTPNDELATVDLGADLIEYQRPTALIAKPHRGEMIQFGGGPGSRIDLLVTPAHRMVIYAGQSQKGPLIREAGQLTIWDKIKTTAGWAGSGAGRVLIPGTSRHPAVEVDAVDLAAFLGWYVAEGSCCHVAGTWRTMISQNPGPKADRLRAVLAKLPWQFHQQKLGFCFSNRQVHDLVKPIGNKYDKRVPQWIKDAGPEVIRAFMASAVDGDGWRQRTAESYATVSKGLADDVMELWLKAGYGVSMTVRPPRGSRIRGRELPAANCRPQYHVYRKTVSRCQLRDSRNRPNFRRVPYDGMVYCASVPNGTLIVRRNGKVAVCGNCLVGCAVGAAVQGLTFDSGAAAG